VRPEPTRIAPIFKTRIWGARSLAPLYPEKNNLSEPIGEAWLTDGLCELTAGPIKGTLNSAWRGMPAEWRGTDLASPTRYPDFPLLVKFLFPTDQLSIQVHPRDAYAREHESPTACGKTEMWHAVSAAPGASLLLGLVPGADREQFHTALLDHSLEKLIQRWPVSAGDTFYVPAGTPHTLGADMLICEVQQHSDYTYRLYDFDRVDAAGNRRELHVEKGLAVLDFEDRTGGKVLPIALPMPDYAEKNLLVACPYFAGERWNISAPHHTKSEAARFELLIVLEGSGHIEWHGGSSAFKRGECWFIPAKLGQFSVIPDHATSLLRAYVPNVNQVRAQLSRNGVPDELIHKVVFDEPIDSPKSDGPRKTH
jgi:mannose-6-phosphate isomerase